MQAETKHQAPDDHSFPHNSSGLFWGWDEGAGLSKKLGLSRSRTIITIRIAWFYPCISGRTTISMYEYTSRDNNTPPRGIGWLRAWISQELEMKRKA